jgi:hypothetical protein
MPFHSSNEVQQRLTQNPQPLSDQEIIDLYPWLQQLSVGGAHRLHADLTLRNIQSIERFDRNSSNDARSSFLLNIVMLVLSVLAICIALGAYRQAERSGRQQQATLDAARIALEQVLATTNEQQQLLRQSVDLASQQLSAIRARQTGAKKSSSRPTK